MKHTQGPWEAFGTQVYKTQNEGSVIGAKLLCNCPEFHKDSSQLTESYANARLIAAAPAMLEIVKAYRNLLKTMAHTDNEVATYQHIQSVIAKIEGI